jgi:diguanylate cyclase (GGDEF)-like protein
MQQSAVLWDKSARSWVRDTCDGLVWVLALYAVPIAIGLLSLAALWSWDDHLAADDGIPVLLQVVPQADAAESPGQARLRADVAATVRYFDTQRAETPFWFVARGLPTVLAPAALEFPSRHARAVACWDHATLTPLGEATLAQGSGALSVAKAGFALDLPTPGTKVLCKAWFSGPARLIVLSWQNADLQKSVAQFHRKSGLLDGGLILLATFVLMTAWINRRSLYVLFAAWLVVTLRMGAITAGWDTQWLGHTLPVSWLANSRAVTVAVYGLLTLSLYRTLFHEELGKTAYAAALRYTQWLCLPFLVVSFVMPYRWWLPMMWAVTGAGLLLMVASLVTILRRHPSRVAWWYGASLGVTFISSLSEIVAAVFGLKELVGAANFVTVALSAALLAALAIAEQMRLEHEQRLQVQAELEHNFNAMPIGLFTLDLQGRFQSANPALLEMLGAEVLEPRTSSWQRCFSKGAWTQLHHLVYHQVAGEIELRGNPQRPELARRRFLVKATLANDKIEGSLFDVTEKSRATEELNFLAHNDPLTKVLNRRGIENVFQQATQGAGAGKPFALAYLDLDRFKLINDLYGHNVGDEILQQVCKRITDVVSGSIRVGRVGGDEFVIVLPEINLPLATLVCEGIVRAVGGTPFHVGEKAFHVRGSMGLVEVTPGTLLKDALSTADRACRDAKRGSGDGLVVYDRTAKAFREHEDELRLVEWLSGSAGTQGLFLEMQPIMSLRKPHEALDFEVLLRMRDPSGKLVPTDRLITAAENSGRMGMIDRWVLSTALGWLSAHKQALPHTRFVCLNLSGASLNDERFLQDVFSLLAANMDIARHLCIEITESVALHDLKNTRHFIDTVRSFGAKVALDDFGAGYTSFSYLKELPADLLKIDGSFIVKMNTHPANVAIVEAIVNLARNLGMQTIAEWAEDAATVQTLAEIGVDYVQGYVIARPQAPEMLLQADSAASFIRDEVLQRFTSALNSRAAEALTQVDLFEAKVAVRPVT